MVSEPDAFLVVTEDWYFFKEILFEVVYGWAFGSWTPLVVVIIAGGPASLWLNLIIPVCKY